LSEHRGIAAAEQFFTRAIVQHGPPERVTLDGYPATRAAVAELKKERIPPSATKAWTSKYLNNLIEPDHRRVKRRIYPMPGFKDFGDAAITISGIELAQKIRKLRFGIAMMSKDRGMRVAQMWEAILVV
jgi:IS6 family transposase